MSTPAPEDTFTHRHVHALDRRVHRLGLAGNYGIDADGFRRALEMGPQYLFWTPTMKKVTPALKEVFKTRREHFVLGTGPTLGFTQGALAGIVDKTRKLLDTDYVDVLHLFWLGRTSAWRPSVVEEMVRLRERGVVRKLGISIHDRERAGQLAIDSPLDLLMIRYNAAHPGAERDIFPHLHHRQPAIVSYTATAWGKLLTAPGGWNEPVATAGDCYRFALSNPHVDVVLTGPASFEQFQQNLEALDKGPLSAEEMDWMRRLGRAAKDSGGKMRWF